MLHPEVAYRDCGHCSQFIYNEKTGEPDTYFGKLIPRKGSLPPCRFKGADGKSLCKKGTPEESNALNQQNQRVYQHYLECKAIGHFPDDAIVRRNASLIRQVEDSVQRVWQVQLAGLGGKSDGR